MARVDLNCDMGESFGRYELPVSEKVMTRITSANIACGFHAGDPMVMARTVAQCKEYGVAVGAHPGFPDLLGFGRREMAITPQEARNYLLYQVGALQAFCTSAGVKIQHVKPHGALYNMATQNEQLAHGLIDGLLSLSPRPILVALSGSRFAQLAEAAGLRVCHEVFADRAYDHDGFLVSRSVDGAVINDSEAIAQRALRMVERGEVETIDGDVIRLQADSICIHGDNPTATAGVISLVELFAEQGIEIVPLQEVK
ncbi:MAG TPA: LamB/YcsF family protein [Candidatus Acetothermia bacterium]|nr:LamB/YcsF family protein [Candidatus Acetothermia bacterium]